MRQVAVLTTTSGAGLDDASVQRLGDRLGQGGARRLGPDAAEADIAAPVDLDVLRPEFPDADLNVVPLDRRRKRLLIADMDSTMIPVECIDLLAEYAGTGAEVRAITERAMAGELNFEDSLRARIAYAEGLEQAALERIMAERIRLNPGARTLVRTMAAHGAHTALVSGGFTYFSERVGASAGFAEHRANTLLIEDGRLTGRVAEPVLGREAKVEAMSELLDRHGLDSSDVIAVGDGANDLAMIEAAGLGVAYRPKPLLAAAADAVIRHSDLTALLYLQGYRIEEFVED